MKASFAFVLCLVLTALHSTILLPAAHTPPVPESQKLQIQIIKQPRTVSSNYMQRRTAGVPVGVRRVAGAPVRVQRIVGSPVRVQRVAVQSARLQRTVPSQFRGRRIAVPYARMQRVVAPGIKIVRRNRIVQTNYAPIRRVVSRRAQGTSSMQSSTHVNGHVSTQANDQDDSQVDTQADEQVDDQMGNSPDTVEYVDQSSQDSYDPQADTDADQQTDGDTQTSQFDENAEDNDVLAAQLQAAANASTDGQTVVIDADLAASLANQLQSPNNYGDDTKEEVEEELNVAEEDDSEKRAELQVSQASLTGMYNNNTSDAEVAAQTNAVSEEQFNLAMVDKDIQNLQGEETTMDLQAAYDQRTQDESNGASDETIQADDDNISNLIDKKNAIQDDSQENDEITGDVDAYSSREKEISQTDGHSLEVNALKKAKRKLSALLRKKHHRNLYQKGIKLLKI